MKINVPNNRKIRLVINSDAKNEADDQFAIAHALQSEKFIVKGIIGTHFGRENSMLKSYEECKLIVKLTKQEGKFPVVKGSTVKMKSETEYEYSDGARLIVEEALKIRIRCILSFGSYYRYGLRSEGTPRNSG